MSVREPVEDIAVPALAPPEPVDGCLDCRNLQTRRAYARGQGDESGVSGVNVLLRAHLRAAH